MQYAEPRQRWILGAEFSLGRSVTRSDGVRSFDRTSNMWAPIRIYNYGPRQARTPDRFTG